MELSGIKNIIFDLGNVIIDIDPSKTYEAFAQLSNSKSAEEVETIIKEQKLWANYEKGIINESEFRKLLTQHLDLQATDSQIDHAFNALLLEVEPERIALIKKLRSDYRLFVLSNTSKIHMDEFVKIVVRCSGEKDFWSLFEKPYLSFEMGKLKPEPEIYEQVLAESGLMASETLFLDDLYVNTEAANLLNINTIQVIKPRTIINYLDEN
jgi:glucose-1-phosphatase